MKTLKKLRNNLFKLLHPGDACYCIYCNKSYSKFLHAGVKAEVFKKYKVAGGGYKKIPNAPIAAQPTEAVYWRFFSN